MSKQKGNMSDYDSSQIQVLDGLEAVRKRPGMYIGSTGYDGVHHLIKEIADNSIDEAIAGYATKVSVTMLEDGGIRIDDDGREVPATYLIDKNKSRVWAQEQAAAWVAAQEAREAEEAAAAEAVEAEDAEAAEPTAEEIEAIVANLLIGEWTEDGVGTLTVKEGGTFTLALANDVVVEGTWVETGPGAAELRFENGVTFAMTIDADGGIQLIDTTDPEAVQAAQAQAVELAEAAAAAQAKEAASKARNTAVSAVTLQVIGTAMGIGPLVAILNAAGLASWFAETGFVKEVVKLGDKIADIFGW